MRMVSAVLVLALALGISGAASAGKFEDGVAAFDKGDYATALKAWQPLADKGDASAQLNVALLYAKGQGVPQDFKLAADWCRNAAYQGVPQAQLKLGLLYDNGRGVAQDYAQAAEWYRKAADQGVAEAQFNLAYMYAKGQGVLQDYPQAMALYRKAAAQGVAQAQLNIGLMYQNGRGVPQDFVRAHMWTNIAASQGKAEVGAAATKDRDLLAKGMTPDQIARAQELARVCVASKFKDCD